MKLKMKNKKFKAFTLVELLVIILTLSILLAAFAPAFTKRYSDGARDEVWAYVSAKSGSDSYYDATNKTYPAQAFIGLSPANKMDVANFSKNGSSEAIYSKLIIAASNNAKINAITRKPQNQIQFRYGSSDAGTLVGSLFAGKGNLLFGGPYKNITQDAVNNSSYGIGALENLTYGKDNTAIGYYALNKLTGTGQNTAIGAYAGENTTGYGNTYVGYSAGRQSTSNLNTFIGDSAGYNVTYKNNTAIGYYSLKTGAGEYNTALGTNTLTLLKSASGNSGNTALGNDALKNLTDGKNNTAIGASACNFMENTSNKTCIGAKSGYGSDTRKSSLATTLYSDDQERVYIGSLPKQTLDGKPMAVLEVHNVTGSTNVSSLPAKKAGHPSVFINGNLIVRGQSYLTVPILRPQHLIDANNNKTSPTYKGLVLFKILQASNNGAVKGFAGYDGAYREGQSHGICNGCRQHKSEDIRSNCICTVANASTGAISTDYLPSSDMSVSTSYDWSSPTTGNNDSCNGKNPFGASYTDGSFNTEVTLIKNENTNKGVDYETDKPLAHLRASSNPSCCPVLLSDKRLKNVGEAFNGGLAELKNLKIYNYTFKNDANKIPQVGVIAQDLKLVFPNAVFKGDDGYLKIRWDEMLYATVNSIKTLYSKVEKLATTIKEDNQRLAKLKKDNDNLNTKLDELAEELTKLEANKK